ncbi:MAG: type I DNA topoisomerase [Andreesenia angusta]|nr:type I DNA topoisomerase [Andreesenia angusta]
MAKKLVIVESPAKAKTISKFLGKNYRVEASVGHVRDLPKSKLGVDIDNDFEPKYMNIWGKGPLIKELKSKAKKADRVYLATDPDREGEAISWHLAHILDLPDDEKYRVEFNEITKDTIKDAIKNPRKINKNLVDAQQARRILDRLVGYQISPLLWKKVKKGLSAGRVQSVATKIICDREKEIEEFEPKEYWTIEAEHKKKNRKFKSNFYGELKEGKEKKLEISDKKSVEEILKGIEDKDFLVDKVKRGKRNRNPYLPYTTSSLQQDASRKLGFSTKKTMIIAQQLYEGIDIKKQGTIGLVTYIRTDSTRLSNEAINKSKEYIEENFGKEYIGKGNRAKKKSDVESQDAHEAIRPTNIMNIPEDIKESLSKDQFRLYNLIWTRTVASQMARAEFETMAISIRAGDYIFKSNGSKIVFEGFLKLYREDNKKDIILPELEEGEILKVENIETKQHFTQPPPRYTEASLVKTLEELGIGRPSTYSPTISTILSRNYVYLEKKAFVPTELGMVVTELLEEYFKDILNKEFTAYLEKQLDEVASGDVEWKQTIRDFYKDFSKDLAHAEEEMKDVELKDEETDVICEKCGRNMVIKMGRYGKFLACPGYPDCRNAKPLVKNLGIKCPKCKDGDIIERRSKKGRIFYGCSNYPDCDFMVWDKPIKEKCPECNSLLLSKYSKKGNKVYCINEECNYDDLREHDIDEE